MKLLSILALFIFSSFAQKSPIIVPNEKAFYIVDGDSVSLQMRIYGIDTPEKKQKCQEIKGNFIDCGALSKTALKHIFNKTKGKIKVVPITFGSYGRMLVKIYRNNKDIGKAMVRAGIAFAYGEEYKTEERLARKEKLGFWGYYQKPSKS